MRINQNEFSGTWGVLKFTSPRSWRWGFSRSMDVRLYELELLWSADLLEELHHDENFARGVVKRHG